MNNKEGKRRYKALRDAVTQVINKADPVGLLKMGCPADEYSPEIGIIVARLRDVASIDALRAVLHDVFVDQFDAKLAGPPEIYSEAAVEIWAYLQNEGRTI